MSRNELDDILRSHFRDELAGQRGRALQAFEAQVTRPMQLRLNPPTRLSRLRQWSMVGCAMAACMAVGFLLPKVLTDGRNDPGSGSAGGAVARNSPIIEPEFAKLERTTIWNNIDAGPVMLDGQTPGRKIRRQRIDQYRWTDPQTRSRFEFSSPSEQEVLFEVNRQ